MKAIIPDKRVDEGLFSRYVFLASAVLLQRDHMLGQGVSTMSRDPSLDVWKEIEPNGGKFVFEIAVRLPLFLPKLKGEDEYVLRIGDREYAVSNRHCEIVLDNNIENTYWLGHYLVTKGITDKTGNKVIQFIVTKSLVITKFESNRSTASECIEMDLKSWIETLNRDIPNMIQGMRYNLSRDSYDLLECNDIGRLCPVHILCIGRDRTISNALTVISHLDACPMQSFTRLDCEADSIEDFCSGKTDIDYCRLVLGKATYLHHTGEQSISCILACTACETLLTEWLRDILRNNGLSNKKEGDAFNDLRFSQLLNLIAYFLIDMKDPELKNTIDAVNTMRKLRNKIVHENKRIAGQDIQVIARGIEAVNNLIAVRKKQENMGTGE